MAVNSEKNYYINPKALSFTPNYQGYRNIVYVSIVSNAAIKVYHDDIDGLGYGLDAEYQTWRLSGTTTALGTASAYFIYARLSRSKQTADIIFSVREYTVEGGHSYTDSEGNVQTVEKSDEYFYIKIGSLTATDAAGEDATVNRELTYVSGELGTDKQINEKSDTVFEQMFEFVSSGVEKLINVKQPFKSITVAGESLFKGLVTFVKGFVLGEKEINAIATSEDDYNEGAKDSTLPTTGYVQKELDALDDHFLIKDDPDAEQSVAGSVTFEQDVTVDGDHYVEGVQTIGKEDAAGNIDVNKVVQEVKGKQILHGGFQTPNFNNAAGQITGAHLTPDGKLFVSGLKANNFEIDELIFNVVKAQGGEYVYSTSTVIESCTYVMKDGTLLAPDAFYALDNHDWRKIDHVLITLKEDEFTQYGNPFVVGDIIYGKVNQVQESGKHAIGGECIMHIIEVEDNTLNITAKLYQEGEEGVVANIPPIEDMVIAQRGNKFGVEGRTTSFYLSTITGNIVMLYNVTTPTLSAKNYGATFGKLPYDLLLSVQNIYAQITENDPVVYAKYGIFENLIQMDHLGEPIKTERYRGQWRADVAASDNPYIESLTTYDTVTHNGCKWRIRTSGTLKEPTREYGDWELMVEGGLSLYTLAPSSNIIYVRSDGTVEPSELYVNVNETTTEGTVTISNQVELVSRNLSVWYSIDGSSERHLLVVGGSAALIAEDGKYLSGDDADEGVDLVLSLDGDNINVSEIGDRITLYLVKGDPENPEYENKYVIPVINDGAAPIVVECTPSSLSVPVEAETLATAGVRTLQAKIRLKRGISYIPSVSGYSLYALFALHDGTVSAQPPLTYYEEIDYTLYYEEGIPVGWLFTVTTKHGIAHEHLLERIDISIRHEEAEIASGSLMFNYLERGITGPAGKDGPVLYPAGTWKLGSEYKMTYQLNADGSIATDSDGKKVVFAKPFVYNPSDDRFYVLKMDVPAGSNISITDANYWTPFTHIDYVFTKVLMASWARLARAVFEGDYMFSEKGIDRHGNLTDYSYHTDGDELMFDNIGTADDPHYRLNGNFRPNVFIDFLKGAVQMKMLSEPFTPMAKDIYAHVIDPSHGHNLSVRSWDVLEDVATTKYPKIVFLPEVPDNDVNYDGLRSTIVVESRPNIDRKSDYEWDSTSSSGIGTTSVVICADARLSTMKTEAGVNELLSRGMFAVGGRFAKFIVMEPGSTLHLRCVMSELTKEDGTTYTCPVWYVENSSDFEPIFLNIKVQGNELVYEFDCKELGWYSQSSFIAMGTKYISSLRGDSKKMLSFTYNNDALPDAYDEVFKFNGLK